MQKSITAVKLSRNLEIPKTTLYRYLDVMIQKGFVAIVISPRGREYSIQKNVFEIKLNEAKVEYNKIQEIKPALEEYLFSGMQGLGTSSTRVYYGIDGAKQLIWNVLSAKTPIYYYTSASRKNLYGKKWFSNYCREFVSRDLYEKGFESEVNSSIDVDEYYAMAPGYLDRSEYIILKDVTFNGEVYIYNNIYAYYTWADGKFFGIETENSSLAETQRKIFETFWNLVISSKSYVRKHEASDII
jgi:sugar-specific transcriptional regulator TrmB